jgi:poly(glycerol-phosphate) alpha-glucosyltransferase
MTTPLTGKRIGLLTASASRLGGGVFEAVLRQAAMIRDLGGEAVVFALRDVHAEEDRARFAPGRVVLCGVRGPAQIGYAPALTRELCNAKLDLLHLHGIWMYPSRAATLWARATGRPYLISPHGMLDPWITWRSRWKKALARHGYERASWATAHRFHALTEAEATNIARESGRTDSLVIPNAAPPIPAKAIGPRGQDYLYLGRIHPKKNLSALIPAWRSLTESRQLPSSASLTIAGWGDPAAVAALEAELVDAPANLAFVGPVFGDAKAALLRKARFMVVPSLSEGLPMVVLEAWAAGVPVLMSQACHLPVGFTAGAALDCGTDPATIAAALVEAAGCDDLEWAAMSGAAQGLASDPFSPGAIAARWGAAYAAPMDTKR